MASPDLDQQGPTPSKHGGLTTSQSRGLPYWVITGFTDGQVAKDAGLEIGDVILKVDGEDASQLITERLKYLAHSTPQTGMFYAAERGLVRGPKDSTAAFTVRDLHDQVREVKPSNFSLHVARFHQMPTNSDRKKHYG